MIMGKAVCITCGRWFVRSKGQKDYCNAACRFWPKVERRGPQECWPWLLAPNPKGYGKFKCDGEQLAHRVALWLHTGKRPGEAVRHTCDNPICCNPSHLIDGTQLENIQDRNFKGRSARFVGIENWRSKLTEDQVRWIRRSRRTLREMAETCGVSKFAVWSVVKGRTWRHIDGA